MAIDWLAAYAAGVSTILASQQIVRELPSVKIRVSRDSSIIRHGLPPAPVISVTIGNVGRRPVTIEEVAYIAKGTYISGSKILAQQTPFTLEDGQTRTLYHPEDGLIPPDANFQARDTLGRWWPRGRGLRLRVRRRRMRRSDS
jgi:hypothetical protein